MTTCRHCHAPLPSPGQRGGRPALTCSACARRADADRSRRRRRGRDLRRPEALSLAGWASLHLTDERAAAIARDGLVLPDEALGDDPEADA